MHRLSTLAGIGLVFLGCGGAEKQPETQKPAPKTEAAEQKTAEPQERRVRTQDKDYADLIEKEKGAGGGGASP